MVGAGHRWGIRGGPGPLLDPLTAIELQHDLLAAMALGLLTRAGRFDLSVGPLRDAAHNSGSPFIGALATQAEVLQEGQLSAIGSISTKLIAVGLRATAFDGLILAERHAQLHGGERTVRAIVAAHEPLVRATTFPYQTNDAAILTPREREIATAASRRERNREIAQRLGASVRTVENHLASVYRKLSISGRDELAAHLPADQFAEGATP